ncbi:MAG: hypothetical protein ACK4UJ_09790 [Leptonema sp. (in: bacteria)]
MEFIKRIFHKDLKDLKIDILENQNFKDKIPDRYRLKILSTGETILTCVESPNITVKIQRNFSVSLNEAKKFPERSIFLDGAARGEPFLDNERQIYNLDHHEGCERTFTLATCEQALVLVRKGMNLKEKNWSIYANEPDLDTIFAIWVLLNHKYLASGNTKQYKKIIAILRLEGVIDSLGLELIDILGYSESALKEYQNKLEKLRTYELDIKRQGLWNSINYTEYTHKILNLVDSLVYETGEVKNLKGIVEIARAEITDDDSVVVYEGELGIYELEEYLNKIYDKKPTFVVLKKDVNTYTLRKSDVFSPLDLTNVYDRLNIFDKNVNGKVRENRWGGSSQIGGSPRITGTFLTPGQIVEIFKNAFYKPSKWEKIKLFLNTLGIGFLSNFLGWLFLFLAMQNPILHRYLTIPLGLKIDVYNFLVLVLLFLFGFRFIISSYHVFGFRYFIGYKWIRWIALGIPAAFFGGIWLPRELFFNLNPYTFIISVLVFPMTISFFFFSFLHGILTFYFPIQKYEGKIFISQPSFYVSIIYTIVGVFLPFYQYPFPTIYNDVKDIWLSFLRIPFLFLYSLMMGFLRERSESIITVVFTNVSVYLVYFIFIYFFTF